MKKILLTIFMLILFAENSHANYNSTFYTTSSVFARAMGMGRAYTAVKDGLASIIYNPAAFQKQQPGSPFHLYINPVGAYAASKSWQALQDIDTQRSIEGLGVAGLFFRSMMYATPAFRLTLLLSEELPDSPTQKDDSDSFSGEHVMDWHYHTLSTQIRLAEQVSIGASGYAFMLQNEDAENYQKKFGGSYGITMNPSKQFSAGIAYYALPDIADSLFYKQHRIVNETVNVGVAYQPSQNVTLALDVRNVTEDDKLSSREIHVGAEGVLGSLFAFRGGYYHRLDQNDVYSCGLGIADHKMYPSQEDHFFINRLSLNYSMEILKQETDFALTHYVTMLFRL